MLEERLEQYPHKMPRRFLFGVGGSRRFLFSVGSSRRLSSVSPSIFTLDRLLVPEKRTL
jgi:hypothetical protein